MPRAHPLLAVLLALAAPLVAQDIPVHVPVTPILASRSAIYAQPLVRPQPGWRFRAAIDYTSVVDVAASDNRQLVLDAELLTADLWITRDLSPGAFLFANIPVRGAYDGALDAPINGYHKLTGLRVPARDRLPENVYDWHVDLPDTSVRYAPQSGFLGDLRLGAGWRFGRSQLVVSMTLPTTTATAEGWGRETVGTSFAWTRELHRNDRVLIEAGVTAGWTPVSGALARYQRENFLGAMTAVRWRFSGRQALFATIWGQGGAWRNTGMRTMDNADLTIDFGGLLRFGANWPEVQLGMTEDLYPDGPAVDVGFRAGVRW